MLERPAGGDGACIGPAGPGRRWRRPSAVHTPPASSLLCKYITVHASTDTVPSYSVVHFSHENYNERAMQIAQLYQKDE